MNIQAYIQSGILEEYVLGTVSGQEKQEVECMSKIYPEIKEELGKLELALEGYALELQTPPPVDLKLKIFDQMDFGVEEAVSTEDREGEVIQKVSSLTSGGIKEVKPLWPKLAIAASVLLILVAAWAVSENFRLQRQADALVSEINTLKAMNELQVALTTLYRDPNYRVIPLKGVEKSPESRVVAFWNGRTNEVMLDVQKLPLAPEGKQYQLWSIIDGIPVDMGMLEKQFDGKVLHMKSPPRTSVAAFAITLEKEGGNPSPTLSEMVVMGSV